MNNDSERAIPATSWQHLTKRGLLGTVSALGLAVAITAGMGTAPALAKSKHQSDENQKSKQVSKEPFGSIPSGPVQIFVSINQQKLHLYSNGHHVADAPIATGVPGHLTPMGVFSVIEKDRFHHSNIYSGAPMPYMQRITWSGVALHEGTNLGHPASHGCIRMPREFAARLWVLTKLGARVIIARNELQPTDFSDSRLFVHKERPGEPVAVNLPAGEPIKTAQAIDPTRANDATPLQATPRQPELIEAGTSAAAAAATAPESTDVAPMPAAKAAEVDPSLIEEGKDIAEGAAVGAEAGDAAPAAAATTETTGSVATTAPLTLEPAAPAPADTATIAETAQPAAPTPIGPSKADTVIAQPTPTAMPQPVDAAPAAIQPPKAEVAKEVVAPPAPQPDFAAQLRIPSIINAPKTAARTPASAVAPVAVETTVPASDIAPLSLDAVPMPEARPTNIAKILAERAGPIAVFISRKEGKIFVRQRFNPVFDAPITISEPQQPLGTHVFTAMEYQSDNSTFRWTAVSLAGEPPRAERHNKDERSGKNKQRREAEPQTKTVETKPPQTAHEALARIQIAQDVIDRIEEMMIPGSSLVISDQGLGPETGKGTDFIVVTR